MYQGETMKLSPVTRYFLRKLLNENAQQLGLTTQGISQHSDSLSVEQVLERVFELETKTTDEARELEIIIELYRTLQSQHSPFQERLRQLELRVFALLGLQLHDFPELKQPTRSPVLSA
jgi:DNA-binding MarR family transcriptional regulator